MIPDAEQQAAIEGKAIRHRRPHCSRRSTSADENRSAEALNKISEAEEERTRRPPRPTRRYSRSARDREGRRRLITTNFDRLFQKVRTERQELAWQRLSGSAATGSEVPVERARLPPRAVGPGHQMRTTSTVWWCPAATSAWPISLSVGRRGSPPICFATSRCASSATASAIRCCAT